MCEIHRTQSSVMVYLFIMSWNGPVNIVTCNGLDDRGSPPGMNVSYWQQCAQIGIE